MDETTKQDGWLTKFIDANGQLLVTIIFSLLSAIFILAIYVLFIAKHFETKVGSVDVQQLMQEVTLNTYKQMAGKDDEKQAQIAARDIKNGSAKIELAIANIATKNDVILIQKQAFVYNKGIVDYTSEVRNEINQINQAK